MSKYILRLDDAAPRSNIENWNRMEQLLEQYNVKPLVGVIPNCKDPEMDEFSEDLGFWDRVKCWEKKGWMIALHGYEHLYCTENGGINPVNARSEFAGLSLVEQKKKIANGMAILKKEGIYPKVFFAPSHTFDKNTLVALKEESDIRIISDTVSDKPYSKYGMTFVPQQSGRVRELPFSVVTFCYHPNTMNNQDFVLLEEFLSRNGKHFVPFPLKEVKRRKSIYDSLLSFLYFMRR